MLILSMALGSRILRNCQIRLSNGIYLTVSKFTTKKTEPNVNQNESARMSAWQIHSYGTIEELQLSKTARLPSLTSPNEVLVKVLASSVNPIDVMMISGYGASVLNTLRQVEHCTLAPELEFPLILGRDCCGEVIAKGNDVGDDLNVGDIVYGVIPVHHQGCHAENVVLNKRLVRKKPDEISVEKAASLLYVGMTAWSALKLTGDLWLMPSERKKVLVIGASGGVGTVAVQLLKSWNAEVVAICNKDAVPLVKSLCADHVIDYTAPEAMHEISRYGKYDIIFDVAGIPESDIQNYIPLLKEWALAKYITLRSPLLRNFDNFGLIPGMFQNAKELLLPNLTTGAVTRGSSIRWAFFVPLPNGLDEIHHLIATKKIKPVIHKKFKFSELPLAYKEVQKGHLRGKVVVTRQ
ncbi:NAD(P)H oxidoreductase RTN4IP1, mitochondrial-like [Lycorma delicatula]|uniref:NAD(P)H oxidoreductase RTN4IP1, mitochondrial-like n=1 Tax=Lycorma delicatula TaxID=130591 RepID=UPI003F51616E